jgi:hypothetical protein
MYNHSKYVQAMKALQAMQAMHAKEKKGKVAIGKARYLLNIVYLTLGCSNHLFSV